LTDSNSQRVDKHDNEPLNLAMTTTAAAKATDPIGAPRVKTRLTRVLSVEIDREPWYMMRQQRQLRGLITTDVMLTVIELTKPKLTPQKLASRQFPMEFLCEFANAVMDDETIDMLKYRLLK